jgi:hypothetical protein
MVKIFSKDALIVPSLLKTEDGKVITYIEEPLKEEIIIHAECEGAKGIFKWRKKNLEEKVAILNIKDAISGKKIDQARLFMGEKKLNFNRDGYLLVKSPNRKALILARGYIPEKIEFNFRNQRILNKEIFLTPVFGGILHGKIIAIDPEHKDIASGGVMEEKSVNFEVANYLFKYLSVSGAKPILTRKEDERPSNLERLRKIEASSPEILIIIGYGGEEGVYVSHYPGSVKGCALALSINRYLNGKVSITREYLVSHSSMPAVYVHPIMEFEEIPPPNRMMLDAYKIFTGIVEYFLKARGEKHLWEVVGVVTDKKGVELSGVCISLDGWLKILSGDKGGFSLYLPRNFGPYNLLFKKEGYAKKRIKVNQAFSEKIRVVMSSL